MTTTSTHPVDLAYLQWKQATSHQEYGPYESVALAKELATVAVKWADTWTTGEAQLKRQEAAARPRRNKRRHSA